jgi:hypothetical protein
MERMENIMAKKQTFAAVIILAMVFMLVACGGGSKESKGNVADAVDKAVSDAFSGNSFSEKAAAQALKDRGIDEKDIEPDFEWEIDEDLMATYGDNSHGSIMFIKKGDDDMTDDEYDAWLKKVFDATAKASDDGHNIQGFSFGDGDVEKTWDEVISSDSFMTTWSYKYKDQIMDVYPDREQNPNKESETITEPDGKWNIVYHYYAVKIDIANGLQKSFDETMKDAEEAIKGHEDEIAEALKDF